MREVQVRDTITINRRAGDIYEFWRHLENLPRFIGHLNSVEDLGGGRNRWTIKTPLGQMTWESEIVEDKKNEVIRWRSTPDSGVKNSGSLILKEADGGTGATIELRYTPPGKHNTFLEDKMLETITGEQIKEDLLKLKNLMESGEL